jgi:hypothetical protein
MLKKKILKPDRTRAINGGFSYIPHRFLTGGFLGSLNREELLLYFFLVLVGDRHGLSFYCHDRILTLLQFTIDDYLEARQGLVEKDLIAFDGSIYQVLELPPEPRRTVPKADPAEVRRTILRSLEGTGQC